MKVFVCWDSDLIPETLSQPAEYPGAKSPAMFKPITDEDRLEYFARYKNASMGATKKLFLDWAKLKGPMSAECQQLNHLYSLSVDGNTIKIPPILESPPQPPPDAPPFILSILHNAAREFIEKRQRETIDCNSYTFDAMELLLSRDDIAMSEFELLKLTHRWCRLNQAPLLDFLHLFDVNRLTAEEKSWTLDQLPPTRETASDVLNALCRYAMIFYETLSIALLIGNIMLRLSSCDLSG
jgi:hypothetical protein